MVGCERLRCRPEEAEDGRAEDGVKGFAAAAGAAVVVGVKALALGVKAEPALAVGVKALAVRAVADCGRL
jgi:hypothetical protein